MSQEYVIEGTVNSKWKLVLQANSAEEAKEKAEGLYADGIYETKVNAGGAKETDGTAQ